MKKPLQILVPAILCFITTAGNPIAAQELTITGTVYDDVDKTFPIPQAVVTIKGTSEKVETDIDGHYCITACYYTTLVFTHIGNKSIEVQVEDKNIIDIILAYDPDSSPGCSGDLYIKKRTFFGRVFHSIGNIFR